jgi:hypothetical protein
VNAKERLCHDAAWACAVSIMECLDGLFREEEKRDGFFEVFRRVKASIEAFTVMAEREGQRLKPSRN